MEFVTDKQTLDDLNILGRYKNNSIFSLFNHTVTVGGSRLLEKMFQNPFTTVDDINKRAEVFAFFQKINVSLPFTANEFEIVENYIRNPETKNRLLAAFNITKSKLLNYIANEKEYVLLREGLEKTIAVFFKLKQQIQIIEEKATNTPYHKQAKKILDLLNNKHFDLAYSCVGETPLPYKKVLQLDYIFRSLLNNRIEDLVKELYELDVYITVSNVARENKYIYAKVVDKQQKFIDMKGVYHPVIANAVANDIYIGKEQKGFLFNRGQYGG